uniref:Uncharacterized protein n=1 Tax=Cacopsylla melanoneura TaxID=428564 RepID=A0A8D8RIU7_9HEMI
METTLNSAVKVLTIKAVVHMLQVAEHMLQAVVHTLQVAEHMLQVAEHMLQVAEHMLQVMVHMPQAVRALIDRTLPTQRELVAHMFKAEDPMLILQETKVNMFTVNIPETAVTMVLTETENTVVEANTFPLETTDTNLALKEVILEVVPQVVNILEAMLLQVNMLQVESLVVAISVKADSTLPEKASNILDQTRVAAMKLLAVKNSLLTDQANITELQQDLIVPFLVQHHMLDYLVSMMLASTPRDQELVDTTVVLLASTVVPNSTLLQYLLSSPLKLVNTPSLMA